MKNLTYKAVENSKNSSGEGGNNPAGGNSQLTTNQIQELMDIATGIGCNYFQHHVFMDTDAQMQANYTFANTGDVNNTYTACYNLRTLEEEAQAWCSAIHNNGMKVVHRGSWSAVKGNNGFQKATYGTSRFVPLGTVSGASTEGETTYCGKMWRYMNVNVGASNIEDGDIFAPISEATEYLSDSSKIWFSTASGTQTGLKNFFLTMHQVVDAYGAYIGKNLGFFTIFNLSEYYSGYLGATLPNDTGIIAIDYYGHRGGYSNGDHVEPEHYVTDWTQTRANTFSGKPLFQTEMGGIWGDSWPTQGNTPAAHSRPIRTYEESAQYQIDFWRAYRDSLVNPGLMVGVSNWGLWSGQNSSIVRYTNSHYYPNYMAQLYGAFLKGDGIGRIPVPASTTWNSYGNRDNYF